MSQKPLTFAAFNFLLVLFSVTFAQGVDQGYQKKLDSLNNLLQNKKADTLRVNRLNEMTSLLIEKSKYDQAMVFAQESRLLSEKLNFDDGRVYAYSYIGDILKNKGKVTQGITYFNKALAITQRNKNTTLESYVFDQLGLAYWTKGDTTASLENHRKSLQLREKDNNTFRQAQSNGNIAIIYSAQGKIKEAIAYYKASLKFYNQLKETSSSAWSAGNIGLMNYWLGNNAEALKYFIIALEKYNLVNNNEGFVWISNQISNIYKGIGDHEKALLYAHKVYLNHLKTDDKIGIAESYSLKAGIYFEMKDFQKSKKTYQQSIEIYKQHADSAGIMNSLLALGKVYFELKDYDAALQNVQSSLAIAKNLNQIRIVAKSKMMLGAIYAEKGEVVKARKWLNEALSFFEKSEVTTNLPFTYKYLVKLDSTAGDFVSAFENYKHYIKYLEAQQVTTTDTEKVAMRYEFEKKEAAATAELKNKQTQRNAAIFGLILTTLLVIVLIYFFRLRNKKIIIEKEKLELQKRDIERMKETEQFKSRFLTNITHEFRTPLTLIKAHLEVLKENGRKEDQHRFQEMDNNGSRLLQLINQLLDLSKMESGAYKLQYRSGNVLNESIALAQAFQSLADQKQINLVINKVLRGDVNIGNFVYSQEALSIIISNLLSNAFKFTPVKGTVILDLIFENSDSLTIKVSDTGKGIPEEFLPNVFDRFYQVDQPSQRTYEGSGIGLALVKELAMIHGGDVSVVSSKDNGCIFTVNIVSATDVSNIELEATQELIDIEERDTEYTEEQEANEVPLILVVEDKTELRRFIVENLGAEYRYVEAENGKIGIQLAEKLLPDLIISDVMMPDVDGLELCEYLKSNRATSHIPIMLLTAKANEADKLIGLETGANDYLTKPFSLAEIKLRVKNMLNLRQEFHKGFRGIDIPQPETTHELNKKDREFLENMNQVIETNLSSNLFGVQELSDSMFLSVSQFNRKLKSITGITPATYIRNYKLQKAVEMLKDGTLVAEAGWGIGFEDPVYFSKVFKKHFGYPPSEVKK